jgi:hypothetical protein
MNVHVAFIFSCDIAVMNAFGRFLRFKPVLILTNVNLTNMYSDAVVFHILHVAADVLIRP